MASPPSALALPLPWTPRPVSNNVLSSLLKPNHSATVCFERRTEINLFMSFFLPAHTRITVVAGSKLRTPNDRLSKRMNSIREQKDVQRVRFHRKNLNIAIKKSFLCSRQTLFQQDQPSSKWSHMKQYFKRIMGRHETRLNQSYDY